MQILLPKYNTLQQASKKRAVHFFTKSIRLRLTLNQWGFDMSGKSYDELKAEMETIQQQMVEAKKNERANALKEVRRLCKEFGFTAGMLKGSLAEGRNVQK